MSKPLRSYLCEQDPRERLRRLAEEASAEQPVIVRVDGLLPDVDPWAVVLDPTNADQPRHGERWLLWDDPRDGTRFATLGVVREVAGEPAAELAEGFAAARTSWQQLVASLQPLGEGALGGFEQLPVLLGGFAFDATVQPGGPWQGWPVRRLWLPRVLVAYMHGRVTATVFAELAGQEHETVHAELLAAAECVDACVARYAEVWSSSMDMPAGYTDAPHNATATDTPVGSPPASDAPRQRPPESGWLETVEAARQAVQRGEAAKLVVARSAVHERPAERSYDAFATALALRRNQPGCVTYALHPGDATTSSFVGASPETLLRLGNRLAESQALAGTSQREQEATGGLAQRSKDRHEQHLVVQAIAEALEPFARAVEADAEPKVLRFADVEHLSTSIHAWLDEEQDAFALLAALHPTPAVNGLPREVALGWLREHEGLERGYFAGPVGWINPLGDGSWVVALRCALLRGTKAWTFAGAGVVAASQPEAEWAETTWKMRAASAALRSAPECAFAAATVATAASPRTGGPSTSAASSAPSASAASHAPGHEEQG